MPCTELGARVWHLLGGRAMKLMMLGAPGAGKGTQSESLSKELSIPTISTGVMLRKAVADATPAGMEMKEYMDRGALVPDSIVLKILEERLKQDDCTEGYILDGVPRNVTQAASLEEDGILFDHVVLLDVKDEEIIARMAGRRSCPQCGATYHIVNMPPKVENVCDKCGATLVRRDDDAPEKVQKRLKVYHDETEPLVQYYENEGILCRIASVGTPAEILEEILKVVRT